MKMIEERAEEYARQYCDGDCDLYGAFCEKSRDKKAFIDRGAITFIWK